MRAQLYDRIIDLDIYYTDEKSFQSDSAVSAEEFSNAMLAGNANSTDMQLHMQHLAIKCPRAGRKPSIDIEYSRVEGNVCYACKLKLSNLYIPFNASWIEYVEVTLGYSSVEQKEHTETITCQVFASYTPTPGPDGYTVLECLIAKAKTFKDRSYNFYLFNGGPKRSSIVNGIEQVQKTAEGKWTIRAVLVDSCNKMNIKLKTFMTDSLLNTPFSTEDIPCESFVNGYAVIGFLQRKLNEIGKNTARVEDRFSVATMLFDDTVYFIGVSVADKTVTLQQDITKDGTSIAILDKVSSVDWNAGTLTVTAPFNPALHPGKLFKISPFYYTGSSALPNVVARKQEQKDPWDWYFIITQSVQFSTAGNNSMTLMAVPFKYSPLNNQEATGNRTEISTKTIYAQYEQLAKEHIDILFGEKSEAEQEVKQQDVVRSLEDMSLSLATSEITDYTIVAGDSLSTVAARLKKDMPFNAQLNENTTISIPAGAAWYPLILLLTYTRYKKNDSRSKLYSIDVTKPDFIVEDNHLLIPQLTWKAVQTKYKTQVVNILRAVYEYYKKNPTTTEWGKWSGIQADCIEKGKIL